MQKTQRLFIALPPTPSARQALARLRDQLSPRLTARPVATGNLHLTLAFLGHVPQHRHSELLKLVQQLPMPEGEIILDTLDCFPKAGVLWAGCSKPSQALETLAYHVRESLLAHEFEFDSTPFRAHITLFRKALPCHAVINPPIGLELTAPGLYASFSTPHGVVYEEMEPFEHASSRLSGE